MNQSQRIEFRIGGMTCPDCRQHVVHALQAVPGVYQVDVPGWQSARATVTADEGVDLKALVAAVEAAGYTATVQSQHPSASIEGKPAGHDAGYDLLVIGGGSGGFAAAIAASDLGARVAMINAGTIGGTCVNVGCIPSKTLVRAAGAWHAAGHHPFLGAQTEQVKLDWPMLRAQKDELVAHLRQGKYVDVLAAYPDITFIEGHATFQADGTVRVGEKSYTARRYVIATGAQPRMLPLPGLEDAQPLNSTTLMDLQQLPRSLIVLGGRAIALELGQAMSRLGVEVLILQRSARLIPDHEPEVGRAIQDYLEHDGLGVLTGVQVIRLSRESEERVVHVRVMGQTRVYRAEQVLMALGRQPNTRNLGLEHVGVRLDENGAIAVNEYLQTSSPTIYATGDVTTNPEFVYVAAMGGALAARNALGDHQQVLDLSAMPAVIFTDPQVASVGLTEAKARSQGYPTKTSMIGLEHVPRAQAAHDTRGLIKLVADASNGRLLGAHILAAEAGEVIQTATLAVKFGLSIDDLTGTLFPYLTQVEGLKLAAQAFSRDVTKLSCCAA